MRIVLDLQGAQTESRYRGIGRYSLAFAQAIARNRGEHEVIVALNGLFPETIPALREAFVDLLPPWAIVVWQAPGPVRACSTANQSQREVAMVMREAFFASLQPDIVHISSLFEGYLDDAVASIGLFDNATPISISFYDLIPLINPQQYLDHNLAFKNHYLGQVEILKKANLLLAISEFARTELIKNIAFDPSQVITVSTATEPIFLPCKISPKDEQALRNKYGIEKLFLLYTGGADERKNLERLLEAFAALPNEILNQYQLVFAGKIHPLRLVQLKQKIGALSLAADQCVFTDYVSNEELVQLYNLCTAFIFPSWHEGFGIPPLEAMRCGVPVIASHATSIPEVVNLPEALFDPFDVPQMTQAIVRVLTDEAYRSRLIAFGLEQAKHFSWDITARCAINAFETEHQARHQKGQGDPPTQTWGQIVHATEQITASALEKIAHTCAGQKQFTPLLLARIARDVARNTKAALDYFRPGPLQPSATWQLEGPFDSSYSLALVNRENARALVRLDQTVYLHSTEGYGDFVPNPTFLDNNPDLAFLYGRLASAQASEDRNLTADIVARITFPPRVDRMSGRLNLLHGYAWEETGFPTQWVNDFNDSLQGIAVCSHFVKRALINNGVTVPIAVTGHGVDHWQRLPTQNHFAIKAKGFRFLHVSSCFPRKGVDALLKAYGEQFSSADDVSLIIKTFENPHNNVEALLALERAAKPDFPEVVVICEDYREPELKALFSQCHAFVAPSRAEGFGLPFAEAMVMGLPVITTNWGGQLDFCNPDTAYLVDYQFALAKTHLNLFDSVWAEPDVRDLGQKMKAVYLQSPQERNTRAQQIRQSIIAKWTWDRAAEKLLEAARRWSVGSAPCDPKVAWISTWNMRCGIATYSEHVLHDFPEPVTIFAPITSQLTGRDTNQISRCWHSDGQDDLQQLTQQIAKGDFNCIVIQFNYGFFDFDALNRFLRIQLERGMTIFVTLHATIDPVGQKNKSLRILAPVLAKCARILVHSVHDLNRLKSIGIVNNAMLFPHGVLDVDVLLAPPKRRLKLARKIVIGSYGFFLPHKGLLELIDAFVILRKHYPNVLLRLVNAEYPIATSAELIAVAIEKIRANHLTNAIELHTDFLSDARSLELLQTVDLVVFPYQRTGESASGAVRYGLAAKKPVAVTPLPIFDDLNGAVHILPGFDAAAIANGLIHLLEAIRADSEQIQGVAKRAHEWRVAHRYAVLARRFHGALHACRLDARGISG